LALALHWLARETLVSSAGLDGERASAFVAESQVRRRKPNLRILCMHVWSAIGKSSIDDARGIFEFPAAGKMSQDRSLYLK
jgi:hypothetical protein